MTDRRIIVDVDERGRVSLARFGLKDTQVVVSSLPDGGLTMHPAVALTTAEARHYNDPGAQEALERGLEDAKDGRVRRLVLRSDSLASD
ncbi:MAG: hypothetical protein WD354_00990 [Acidimicrobiia bacterium]